MSGNVILLEFNELSPTLMSRFISQGHLPNFKRFSDESAVYLTEAAERAPYLDPWIQWVTVHTGLNFAEHHLERLNEGHALEAKRLRVERRPLVDELLGPLGRVRLQLCDDGNALHDGSFLSVSSSISTAMPASGGSGSRTPRSARNGVR